MAEVPTQGEAGGIATVAPDDRVPDDFQHLHATPDAFGAAIGRGMQQFGEGALKASRFYGQVAADDVFNTYQTNVNHLLYGDPSKTTTGPDGATIADRGYFGLKGEDAMRARPDVEKQLDSLMQSSRQQLPTPEAQLHFDTYSRRLRSQMGERIGAHADSSFNTYAGTVNKQSEAVALNGIASNPLDDEAFNHNVADLTTARKKQVDIAGLGAPGAAAAETTSLQDAWKTRVLAIGVHDPAAASKMAEDHKKDLGTEYQTVAEHLRSRTEAANGDAAADRALQAGDAHTANLPTFARVTQAVPGGFSPSGLGRTIQIESSGNPNAGAGTSHVGLGQFSPATWAQFGQGDRTDPQQALLATQRYAAANAPILQKALGRTPTDAELYLAHQQGPGGAVKLLTNPSARAGDLVGDAAIRGNGGDPNAPASAFTSKWVAKFGGAGVPSITPGGGRTMTMPPGTNGPAPMSGAVVVPQQTPVGGLGGATQAPAAPDGTQTADNTPQPPTPEERKAAAYQHVLDDPDLNPAERQHALNRINQTIAAQQVSEAATEKAKKERDEKASNQYLTRVLNQQTGTNIIHEIANDANLTPSSKSFLMGAIEKWSGDDHMKNERTFGMDYYPTLRRVLADAGDPSRISDSVDILRIAADPNGHLSDAGAHNLIEKIGTVRKSFDGAAVERAKLGLLQGVKKQLSYEQNMGPITLRDPDGERIFNMQFIPKFEAAFDAHIKAGKNPWEFLTEKNANELSKGMRSKAQMDMDRMRATSEATGDAGQKLPAPPVVPAPTGVDPKVWNDITSTAPVLESGPVSPGKWQQLLARLLDEPTPEIITAFDKTFGKASPLKAAQLIEILTGKPPPAVAAPGAPVAPTAPPAAQETSTPNNAPITPGAPAAPAAAVSGGGVTAAPAAAAPATAPTVERTGPRMEGGAFYGNEPEPTQADIEAHDRDKAAREESIRQSTEAFKQKREPERAAIDATRKGAESIAARGQAEHDKSTLEKLTADEKEARDRLERLENAAKVGARVGSQTKRLNDQIKDIAAQRKDIEARMKKGPNG